MIYYAVLTYFNRSNELKLSEKLIHSLNSQTDNNYKIILAINNPNGIAINPILTEGPQIKNLKAILDIKGNNIGYSRNQLIEKFLKISEDTDYLFFIDGDDELDIQATYYLTMAASKLKSDELLVTNFTQSENRTPYVEDDMIHNNKLRGVYPFLWYLFPKNILCDGTMRFYTKDYTLDDFYLYLKLKSKSISMRFLMNCVQHHDMTGGYHIGNLRSRNEDLMSYFYNDIIFEFRSILTVNPITSTVQIDYLKVPDELLQYDPLNYSRSKYIEVGIPLESLEEASEFSTRLIQFCIAENYFIHNDSKLKYYDKIKSMKFDSSTGCQYYYDRADIIPNIVIIAYGAYLEACNYHEEYNILRASTKSKHFTEYLNPRSNSPVTRPYYGGQHEMLNDCREFIKRSNIKDGNICEFIDNLLTK